MSVSPFNRVRPTTSLQEPSRIESSAGKSGGGGESIGDLLGVALADISVKSMADVAAGVRATSKKGKGGVGKLGGAPAAAPPPPTQQPGLQAQSSDNDTMAEKIRKAVEQAVVATPVTSVTSAVTSDAFETTSAAASHNALSSFSDDASSTPAAQSNVSESVKPFSLAPVRLRG